MHAVARKAGSGYILSLKIFSLFSLRYYDFLATQNSSGASSIYCLKGTPIIFSKNLASTSSFCRGYNGNIHSFDFFYFIIINFRENNLFL